MAGLSSPTYQSLHNLRVSGVRSMDSSARKEQLRSFFDQMLASSLKDVYGHEPGPIPVLLGDGSCVDLFKMYFTVKERGGYDTVSRDGSWASVAQELGFQSKFSTPLKLVYAKYLGGMDRCFEGWAAGDNSETEMAGLKSVDLESSEGKIIIDLTDGEYVLKQCDMGKYGGTVIDVMNDDREENAGRRVSISSGRGSGSSGKRKQESLVGLLNWLKVIAVNPCHAEKVRIAEGSPAKGYKVDECWSQALSARKARFHGKEDSATPGDSPVKKKQRGHPSLYDDLDATPHTEERVRSSERLSSRDRPPPPVCSVSTPAVKPRSVKPTEARASRSSSDLSSEEEFPYHEPQIGSDFQARIPEWIGETCGSSGSDPSDSKWLGTLTWPSSGAYPSVVDDQIGKGRPSSCTCEVPGSVGCVKLHISEARLNLKHQLGSAFYKWRFGEMGEDVSIAWSLFDERMFKSLIRMHYEEGRSFWKEACTRLRTKSKRSLVSYYFNVFILRLRSVQNRMTPDEIDSDNDQYMFGPIGDDLTTWSSLRD